MFVADILLSASTNFSHLPFNNRNLEVLAVNVADWLETTPRRRAATKEKEPGSLNDPEWS